MTPSSVPARRLEFLLSYACQHRCVFCSESARMDSFSGTSLRAAEIARVLVKMRRAGCDHVTLTGGEPTLQPHLLGALAAARRLGYETYMTSNGRLLATTAFARRLLPLLDELCLSLHGDSARVHDAEVGSLGSFVRLLAAWRNVSRWGRDVFLLGNIVATRRNWKSVPGAVRLMRERGMVRHCLVSNLVPEGRAELSYAALAPSLTEWRGAIPRIVRAAEGGGAALRFFGLPLCVFPEGSRRFSDDLYFSPRITVERVLTPEGPGLRAALTPAPTRRRGKGAACRDCAASPLCGGVFDRYLAERGDGELRALKDPPQRVAGQRGAQEWSG